MVDVLWCCLKSFWAAWSRLAKKIGNVQARVLLTVMYAVVLLPFGVMVRLFSDPLRVKNRPTEWLNHLHEAMDMAWARRQ
jgi:hypothetical protein